MRYIHYYQSSDGLKLYYRDSKLWTRYLKEKNVDVFTDILEYVTIPRLTYKVKLKRVFTELIKTMSDIDRCYIYDLHTNEVIKYRDLL